jgi:hypothetical protein
MNAPEVHAFLLCEQIIRDMQTGYPTLVNVFQVMRGPTLPAFRPFWCYARLSGGEGTYNCRLRIVESATRGTIRDLSLPIEWVNRDYLDIFFPVLDFHDRKIRRV